MYVPLAALSSALSYLESTEPGPPGGTFVSRSATRHGETVFHPRNCSVAQAEPLSAWQPWHPLGIFRRSPSAGAMNRNVCARTLTSAIVCSIAGMWHATHSFPLESALWCVCASIVAARGPFALPAP